jgi:HSP20 family protein
MTLVRWSDPFREFAQLQDRINRAFSDTDGRQGSDEGWFTAGSWTPPVDIEQFHRIERRYGTFSRSFSLPQTVDTGKVAAEYRNGVLTVRLPLREEAKPRQIKVDVAA